MTHTISDGVHPRLVATDLDGTVVREDGTVSARPARRRRRRTPRGFNSAFRAIR
ncbi:hypothetical protein ACGFY7_10840 [Streptomyces prunicolor]|uniref:hypothetical protein n=1 Tax=Streptomyces prunicolor TaxID=67348 RepID=UPI003710C186